MNTAPISLHGSFIRLEPLTLDLADRMVNAAADGELWNLPLTEVPTPAQMEAYIESALIAQRQHHELPFVIVHKEFLCVCGTTRFRNMAPTHRRLEIGSTWLAASWQKTIVNTEAKLLLLTHAFDQWACQRVEFLVDAQDSNARTAIERLGAQFEGILRNHLMSRQKQIRDRACYSVIASEWPAIKQLLQRKINECVARKRTEK